MKSQYLLDCPSYLKEYLTYIRVVRNYTERTIDSYYIDLRLFLRYLKVKYCVAALEDFDSIMISDVPISYLENFTLKEAYEYMSFLVEFRRNSSGTRFRKTSSLKMFYQYLEKVSLIPKNLIAELERPKPVQNLPKFLTLEQSLKLLDVIEGRHQERDFCMILLFLSCGMRLSELIGLNIDDYCESARTLRIFGKGQKERIVYLNEACITALNEYLAVRPRLDPEPRAIFLSDYRSRISTRRVQRIIENFLQLAGLGNYGFTVHKLRHTAATLLYENGVDLMTLKDILGHRSVASTEIYTHISDIDRKRAADKSPFANVKKKFSDIS